MRNVSYVEILSKDNGEDLVTTKKVGENNGYRTEEGVAQDVDREMIMERTQMKHERKRRNSSSSCGESCGAKQNKRIGGERESDLKGRCEHRVTKSIYSH